MDKKNVTLLGSTGSIGLNTLEVIRRHSDRISVKTLAARKNWKKLEEQVREFNPKLVCLYDEAEADCLRKALKNTSTGVVSGKNGLFETATFSESDTVVSALVGSVGLEPIIAAIDAGKNICLANKETLVVGGKLVMESARKKGIEIIPIDSEHSAIFQCLRENDRRLVKRLILTASGGPFRKLPLNEFSNITPADALKHPNWEMGGKTTIDSATLMNKGLEVIEARWLFNINFERIEVVVHPQSIIHSMVEFVDGSMLAQLGAADMRVPIQYALSYPDRWAATGHRIDLLTIGALTFEEPRQNDFPCLLYAYEAGNRGGTMPCTMNAANEVAVEAFLKEKITFLEIPRIIRNCMDKIPVIDDPTLAQLLENDFQARSLAAKLIP
ncbi:MAG: 1-deoxy-D-xylulose-5-phosphate reductoisomerase [Candidatus Riflebacteria bacterium]|nr:1-deoxy-D-xylulose-5-phosphate reductoisomerase [Candidatus Riflebacteria bacterium]